MAKQLQGLRKHLNAAMGEDVGKVPGSSKEYAKHMIQDAINDALVEWVKTWGIEEWVAGKVREAAQAVGFDLNLTDIRDKDKTREDVDKAITAKVNSLAGTTFESLRNINREAVRGEIANLIGQKLGVGDIGTTSKFRDAMGAQLLQAFDGASGAAVVFAPHVVEAIENNVVAGWKEITTKTVEIGNPSARFGPPRDAAHAAVRAANRKRQAKYRAKHYLKWVGKDDAPESTGNGREGLTGKDSGNVKPVRRTWLMGSER